MQLIPDDLRFAARSLARSKGMVLVVCLSIAIAIAGNASVFSLIEALVLRPIPYPEAERLVFLFQADRRAPDQDSLVSAANFIDFRARSRSFSALEATRRRPMNFSGVDQPEELTVGEGTTGLLPLLGIHPILGRGFVGGDDRPGDHRVALLSHPFFERRFGADPAAVGATIRLDGEPYTVIGVLPADYEVLQAGVDLWLPLAPGAAPPDRDRRDLIAIGRLAPGITASAARREVEAVMTRLAAEHPAGNRDQTALVRSLREQIPSRADRKLYALLQVAMFLVLLIACSNVANLLLSRTLSRRQAISVQCALGASRFRVARGPLAEAALLAFGGGALGLLLAAAALAALRSALAAELPKRLAPTLGAPVVLFSLGATVVAALLIGLLPALLASRPKIATALQRSTPGATAAPGRRIAAHGLVVFEMALALVLVCGTALLVRALIDQRTLDPGFPTERLATFRITLPASYRDGARASAFERRLAERLAARPEISAVAATTALPRSAETPEGDVAIAGAAAETPTQRAALVGVAPGYFSALGVPRLAGRDFADGDRAEAPPVAILSREAARRLFGEASPIGRRIELAGRPGESRAVVGVVGDVIQGRLLDHGGPPPVVYLAFAQQPERVLHVLVRTRADASALAAQASAAVAALDRDLPVADVLTFSEHLEQQFGSEGMLVLLLGLFGFFALLLAALGVYGVIARSVAERAPEIGIRMALGAGRAAILRMFAAGGLRLTLFGFLLGAPGVWLATRTLLGLLAGAVPVTLAIIPIVTVALAALAGLAAYEPASRAASRDPAAVLRG